MHANGKGVMNEEENSGRGMGGHLKKWRSCRKGRLSRLEVFRPHGEMDGEFM